MNATLRTKLCTKRDTRDRTWLYRWNWSKYRNCQSQHISCNSLESFIIIKFALQNHEYKSQLIFTPLSLGANARWRLQLQLFSPWPRPKENTLSLVGSNKARGVQISALEIRIHSQSKENIVTIVDVTVDSSCLVIWCLKYMYSWWRGKHQLERGLQLMIPLVSTRVAVLDEGYN